MNILTSCEDNLEIPFHEFSGFCLSKSPSWLALNIFKVLGSFNRDAFRICQTSMIANFVKIVNAQKPLTSFAKNLQHRFLRRSIYVFPKQRTRN